MCENDTLHWEHLLPPMAFAYNTSVHTTTGMTPAFLLFGYNPVLPGLIPPSLDESENNNRLQGLQRARDAAHEHSTLLSNQYKNAHDKNAAPLNLSPGQQVLVDVRLFPNSNKKLADKFEGPFFIYKVHPKGVIDILKNNKIHRVNIDRIKPYIAPPPGFEMLIPEEQTPPGNPPLSLPGVTPDEVEAQMPPTQIPVKRGPGRPRKTDAPASPPLPYNGPVTRARAQSTAQPPPGNVANQISENQIMAARNFRSYIASPQVRDSLNKVSYRHLIRKNPHLRDVKQLIEPLIYYGDNQSRDEFGIPVTPESIHSPAYLNRRRFLMGLTPAMRNRLLTGDPHFSLDPVFYEYVWSNPHIPVMQRIAPHLFPPGPQGPPGGGAPDSKPKLEPKWDTDTKPKLEPKGEMPDTKNVRKDRV